MLERTEVEVGKRRPNGEQENACIVCWGHSTSGLAGRIKTSSATLKLYIYIGQGERKDLEILWETLEVIPKN